MARRSGIVGGAIAEGAKTFIAGLAAAAFTTVWGMLATLIAGVAAAVAAVSGLIVIALGTGALFVGLAVGGLLGRLAGRRSKRRHGCRLGQTDRVREHRHAARRIGAYMGVFETCLASLQALVAATDATERRNAARERLQAAFDEARATMTAQLTEDCDVLLLVARDGRLVPCLRRLRQPAPLPGDGRLAELTARRDQPLLPASSIEELAADRADMFELRRRGYAYVTACAVWAADQDRAVALVVAVGRGEQSFAEPEESLVRQLAALAAGLWGDHGGAHAAVAAQTGVNG